jgi:hypothetical protein
MTPHLPRNLMTITPVLEGRNLTENGVFAKYGGRVMNDAFFAEIRADLADIRAMDTYEGKTNEIREGAKRALRKLLDREP